MPHSHSTEARPARRRDRRRRLLAVAVVGTLGLVAAACSDESDGASADPTTSTTASAEGASGDQDAHSDEEPAEDVTAAGEWPTVDAADAGLDREVLDDLAVTAEEAGSNCLVVTRDGRLVDEWYWNDTAADSDQEIFSATKSVTSVLVGLAADEGALTLDDPASRWIPQWVGTPSESVTVRNLLSNDSGREHSIRLDYVEMAAKAIDKTGFSIDLGQDAAPGETWEYNNAAIQTLEQVLEGATGRDVAEFADERLFAPIGMADTWMARDHAGNPMTFMGVHSTCRDMARFGTLMLRGGTWGDEQVVSEEWVRDSTTAPSQEHNAAYGWLWWLNHAGPVLGATGSVGEGIRGAEADGDGGGGDGEGEDGGEGEPGEDRLVPDAPGEMFFAQGLGGQIVAVDPTSDTVVVRLGPSGMEDPEAALERPRFGSEQAAVVAAEGVVDRDDPEPDEPS